MPAQPQASPRSHTPFLTRIDPSAAGKARKKLIEMGHELWSGECSCKHWSVPVAERQVILDLHDEHLQEVLGPDREGGERG